ncbi:protoporphyrinogen/coproporphyrinogen oxidase [Kitasatospora sp. NPDC058965]|uniref:protoporphyrinogen/coproporphyrinogen oxidase n=1 Tax=Kitasatospora sp. NPDC058965 TaxID=3346682 RepID=UPI0036981320
MPLPDLDVAVIGAGLAGLSTAHHLTAAGRSVAVFEAADRVGGRTASSLRDGFRIDEGAETIASRGYPATWELIRATDLGRADVLPVTHSLALWRGGSAHPYLGHPRGLLTGAGMSLRGRADWLRFAATLGSPSLARPDATRFADLSIRHAAADFHPDLHDALLQPLAACFFGWDTSRSAMGPLAAVLAAHGTGSRWLTYRDGMDSLTRALAARLSVTLSAPLGSATMDAGLVRLDFLDGTVLTARQAVLALPAPQALALRPDLPVGERPFLESSTYAPMLKAVCLLERALPSPTPHAPSYGLLFPARENRVLSGAILDHLRAPNRAPAGRGLVSLFLAPSVTPGLLTASDDEIATTAVAAAAPHFPGLSASVLATHVFRHPHGLPACTPPALRLRRGFMARPRHAIDYAGDWVVLRPNSEAAAASGRLAAARVLATAAAPTPYSVRL